VKSASGFPVLVALGLTMAFVSVGHAEGGITGSVLRVDEQTCRIQFDAYCEVPPFDGRLCLGEPPVEGVWPDCHVVLGYVFLNGAFGVPRENGDCDDREQDHLFCYFPSERLSPWYSSQFDFEAPPGLPRLTLEWGINADMGCSWCYPSWGYCQPAHVLCVPCSAGGLVNAILPTRVGDLASFEPIVAVESTPWGVVKELYR